MELQVSSTIGSLRLFVCKFLYIYLYIIHSVIRSSLIPLPDVSGRSRFFSIRGYIVHWLPAAQQIEFKVFTLAVKALNGLAPSYRIDLNVMPTWVSRRPGLRSSSELRLVIPKHGNNFAICQKRICSGMPTNMKQAASRSQTLVLF